jgi:F-type H+-transporting ATPase subunit b
MHLLLLAQEAEEATRVVLPEIDELIFGTIAFLILFAVLSRIAFPAMRKALQAREQAIKSELERAEQARLEAEKEREEYARKIAEARTEADRLVREATEATEQIRRDRIAKAEDEARQIVERARADAGLERERMLAELRREMAQISIEAATRIIEKELSDPDALRQLVDQFIDEATATRSGDA